MKNNKPDNFLENRSILDGIRYIPKYINLQNISTGLLAGIFGWTCVLLIVGVAQDAGLSEKDTISWVFACWTFGGLIGAIVILKYKVPISGAWSIPGTLVIASALQHYTMPEIKFACLVSGVIVLILGLTGAMSKIMRYLPMPIVMGMVAGALLSKGTGIPIGIVSSPLVAGMCALVYLIALKFRNKIKIPPILVAFITAIILLLVTKQLDMSKLETVTYTLPTIGTMKFSIGAIASVSIPLTLLVIGAENAQAIGVLMSQGYKPPINYMTKLSGIGGIVASIFGGHNANIAGPMSAICASPESGPLEGRYVAGLIATTTAGLSGVFASYIVPFIAIVPTGFLSVIAGLALVGVLIDALGISFGGIHLHLGAFFAFVVAASNINILGVGAPFWALLIGFFVSYLNETSDLRAFIEQNKKDPLMQVEKKKN